MRARAAGGWLLWTLSVTGFAATPPEQQWLTAVQQVEQSQFSAAEKTLKALLQEEPNFRLARWLYADVLAARSGHTVRPPEGGNEVKAQDLVDEARLRLQDRHAPPPPNSVPDTLLQPGAEARYLAVVDLSRARLYVLENKGGRYQSLQSFYVGIARNGFGKKTTGDLRTPVGLYHVTGFMPDSELPELYGAGAFPLNYPNVWDQRHRRTGHGIWIHGVPRATYVRPPRSSEGCVTLANEQLLALKPYLIPGKTPVILSDAVTWVAPAQLESARKEFLAVLEAWRTAWASKNTARYLSYYAGDFVSEDGMDRAQFAAFKQRVNAGKKYIQVQLDEIEAYRYPGEPGLVVTRFRQNYRSDNLAKVSRKEQFWRRGADGRWTIVSEATL